MMDVYKIHLGIPEMKEFWENLRARVKSGNAGKDEQKKYAQIGKTMNLLSLNPRHPGLNSHEIPQLSARYGMKVWESYLENKTPKAWRLFWVYGPERGDITVIGLEPHPNDAKANSYNKVTLSQMGSIVE